MKFGIILLMFLFLPVKSHAQVEMKFLNVTLNDTLYVGDSISLKISIPNYPAHSGKYWSLDLSVNPYTNNETRQNLLDTIKQVHKGVQFQDTVIVGLIIPLAASATSKFAFSLVYHPSLGPYYSPTFYIKKREPTSIISVKGSREKSEPKKVIRADGKISRRIGYSNEIYFRF